MKTQFEGYTEETTKPRRGRVRMKDFYAYTPLHKYLFAPTGEPWPAVSVDARLPPVPLYDENRKPKLNKKGEPVTIAASL